MNRIVGLLARAVALMGGIVLVGIVVLNTLSIIGRSASKAAHDTWMSENLTWLSDLIIRAGLDEIPGTYELTEAGVAFAIFSFLPVCQFYGSHATVDLFTSGLGQRANRVIRAFWEIVLTATIIFITVQLYQGTLRYVNNGETTLFLQFPVWWSYSASLFGAIVACLVGLYCAVARAMEMVTGREVLPVGFA